MKYLVKFTSRFKQDYKRIQKRHLDVTLLHSVIENLANGKTLPEHYGAHALVGDYRGAFECHIKPDWLLIYSFHEDVLVLELLRTGTPSDLF